VHCGGNSSYNWNIQIWEKQNVDCDEQSAQILQFGQYVWSTEIWQHSAENDVQSCIHSSFPRRHNTKCDRAIIDTKLQAAGNVDQIHSRPRREKKDGRVLSLAWMKHRWKPPGTATVTVWKNLEVLVYNRNHLKLLQSLNSLDDKAAGPEVGLKSGLWQEQLVVALPQNRYPRWSCCPRTALPGLPWSLLLLCDLVTPSSSKLLGRSNVCSCPEAAWGEPACSLQSRWLPLLTIPWPELPPHVQAPRDQGGPAYLCAQKGQLKRSLLNLIQAMRRVKEKWPLHRWFLQVAVQEEGKQAPFSWNLCGELASSQA